jgi:uncharacterized protein (TIGR02996 family)
MSDDTDLNLLLRAVIQNPDEDTPRLMYADRLEELGEYKKAEFIRLQCEMERLRGGGCAVVLKMDCDGTKEWCVRCGVLRQVQKVWGRVWGSVGVGLGFEKLGVGVGSRMSRGFVEEWKCDARTFLRHADALIWNETQVVKRECDKCGVTDWKKRHPNITPGCWALGCKDCEGTGRVVTPRPCPPTAQPIRKVVLTSISDDLNKLALLLNEDGKLMSSQWPGIEFEILPTGTETDSDESVGSPDEHLSYP